MPWVTGVIAKILMVQNSKEELTEDCDNLCQFFWQEVYDATDGSLHIGNPTEVPLDDWDTFLERSHYFIMHPTTFEIPFYLKYPREKTYPPCETCGGHGEDRTEKEEDNGK